MFVCCYFGIVFVEFEVIDKIWIFGEGWYVNSKGSQLCDQLVYNIVLFDVVGMFDGNFILSVNNLYLSVVVCSMIVVVFVVNLDLDLQNSFYLGCVNIDFVFGVGLLIVELYCFVGGVDGKFDVLGKEQMFELVGNYGCFIIQGSEWVLVQQNFVNVLNVVCDVSGNIVCVLGVVNVMIVMISSVCVLINLFGQQISQVVCDYVMMIVNFCVVNEQWVVMVLVFGQLFDIWGGVIGYVLGYEYCNESVLFDLGVFYYGVVDLIDLIGDWM